MAKEIKQADNLISAYYGVSDEDTKKYLEQGIAPPTNSQTYINPNQQPNQQSSLMNQLADAQKQSALAGLKNAYDKNIGAITAQEKLINPAYEGQRSGLRQDSTMQAKDFENFLANKGISASGSAGQGEISRNVALQGGISSSQLQQQKALEDIARMKLDAKRDYESGVASTSADIEMQLLQNKLSEQQRMADIAREDARYNDNLASTNLANEKNEYGSTINRFYENYQAEINNVQNDGDTSNDWQIPMLQAARQQKIQELAQLEQAMAAASSQAEAKRLQQEFENKLKQDRLNYDINKPYFAPKSSGGTPSVSQQKADNMAAAQQLSGDVMTYLDQWASGQAEDRNGQRADQSDMISYLKANAGTLTAQGVDVNALIKWVTENYTWLR
jgi:hypothetical protein